MAHSRIYKVCFPAVITDARGNHSLIFDGEWKSGSKYLSAWIWIKSADAAFSLSLVASSGTRQANSASVIARVAMSVDLRASPACNY